MTDVVQYMHDSYKRAETAIKSLQTEGNTASRFVSGDQSIYNDLYGFVPNNRRPRFQFNRILTTVNQIHGHQIRNRKSLRYVPVENSDSSTADQATKVLTHVMNRNSGLETISDAFRNGALITGMNLLEISMDYRNDPLSGDIVISNNNYNEFFIDPFFRNLDLSDCNYVGKRTYLTKAQAASFLPKYTDEIMNMACGIAPDMKFQFMPEHNYINSNNLMAYDEFYYRTYREKTILVEPYNYSTYEFKGTKKELDQFIFDYPMISVYKTIVPTVRVAFILQNELMSDDANPIGIDEYPFIPCVGYFQPHLPNLSDRIQGVVKPLQDTQFLYNRRKNISLDILESQVNSGWIYKPEALRNVNDIFMVGQGRGIPLQPNVSIADSLQKIPSPDLAQSNFMIEDGLAKEFPAISGVSEELLATATDDKAGILAKLRSDASVTTLSYLFDNLDRSLKILGNRILGAFQNTMIPSKVERIIEEEPTEEFYNKNFGKYDCVVEDGLNSSTQRQVKFVQIMALQQSLQELGTPLPADIFMEEVMDAITINDKDKLIESLAKQQQAQQQAQEQQAQMQQAQLELEQKKVNSQLGLESAKTQAEYGLNIERNTRAAANLGLKKEREMEAIKDLEQAKLDKLKQMVEIQNLDLAGIERLLVIMKAINEPIEQEMVKSLEATDV